MCIKSKMEYEELKIEIPIGEEEQDDSDLQLPIRKYENKVGGFVIGFDVNSKESVEKRSRRQKRFGIIEEEKETVTNDDDHEETINIPVPEDLPKIPTGEIRHDALLIHGIENMSTEDVFNYFQDFVPGSIEWIDDSSCNVVWEDDHSAARALHSMGKTIDNELEGNSELVWKVGPAFKQAKNSLLLRFSTKKDKKQSGAATRSMYYLVHGRPGKTSGCKGLVSKSRKRKILQDRERAKHKYLGEPDVEIIETMESEEPESMEVDEPAIKVLVKNDRTTEGVVKKIPERLRMRLHADDDEGGKNTEKNRIQDRLQDRLQPQLDQSDKNEGIDLRERLKSRRKHGFDFLDRPSLSIEIREEDT